MIGESGVNFALNEKIASSIIQCHASMGYFSDADKVIETLDKRSIDYGKGIEQAYIVGAAGSGDIEKLEEYLELYDDQSDRVLLQED